MKRVNVLSAVGLVLGASLVFPVHAQFKVSSSFTNSTESGWTLYGNNADSGILTGGSIDAAGNGWLRLTNSVTDRTGRALYTGGSVPSSSGVVVGFDYVSWGGNGADGISVFLYNASADMSNAKTGASLGYCWGAGGYLGIGVDEWGNFSRDNYNNTCMGSDGTGPGQKPDSIALRGPVTAQGNPFVATQAVAGSLDEPGVTTRPSPHTMRFSLIPKGSGTGYRVTVYRDGVAVMTNQDFSYTAPTNLRIGVAASTGGSYNYHEIRNFVVSSPADVSVTKTVSAASILRGHPVTYTLVLRNEDINSVDAGNQSPVISAANGPTLTDLLPTEVTSASWTCTASTGSTCPATAGSGNIQVSSGVALASAGTLTYTITGTVSPTAQCGKSVSNTATTDFPSSSGFADSVTTNNTSTAAFTVACPGIVVSKVSSGGAGAFAFTGTNGLANQTITTATAGTAVDGAAQTTTASNQATVLTETAQSGWVLTGIDCSGLGTGGTATPDLSAGTLTLDTAATDTTETIKCTFRNSKQPVIRLQKALPAARVGAGDQFQLGIAGGASTLQATTSGSGSQVTSAALALSPAALGQAYTLSETAAGTTVLTNYTSTWACSNALSGGQAPSGSGSSFSLTPVAGDDLTCVFSNQGTQRAELSISKSNGVSQVVRGQSFDYQIVVTNGGPSAADGAVVRDPAVQGLGCSAVSCAVSSGAAQCPAAGSVTVAALQSSTGISLPALPANSAVTLTLTCAAQ